ncbi:hypothetical protein CEXT_616031 [Caerostris extrusa]|uniref:Uncharacterized protein n=1 Tax=Caerostris extrusa TaxID=172846 RepID=A0AAV4SLZ0_CAEEX|nr:hypothetical protein CEXT_616031 [Caerostris extrusa]
MWNSHWALRSSSPSNSGKEGERLKKANASMRKRMFLSCDSTWFWALAPKFVAVFLGSVVEEEAIRICSYNFRSGTLGDSIQM